MDSEREGPCEECPLQTEEYQKLHVDAPLFDMALGFLVEHEIGLAPPVDSLTFKECEAIKFVHAYMRIYDDQLRDERAALTGKM